MIVDRLSGHSFVHSGEVPELLLKRWAKEAGQQVISQIELYACVLIRSHYQALLLNRPAIAFIDNEAARMTLIKSGSKSRSMFAMALFVARLEAMFPSGVWYERVCSASNIADGPSRGLAMQTAEAIGAVNKGDLETPEALEDAILNSDLML